MTSKNPHSGRPPAAGATLRVIVARAAEFGMLAALLVVDFELGSRFVTEHGGDPATAGLSTALIAIITAVLALARNSFPPHVTVIVAFSVSLMGSAVSAVIGVPLMSLTEAAALTAMTILVLRTASQRAVLYFAALALVVAMAGVVLRQGFSPTLVLLALLIWGCAIAVGIAGRYAVMKREAALKDARRDEQMELARELHDIVAHQVTGIVVQAQAALAVARTDPSRVEEAFSAIESAGGEALAGMRRIVGAIREEGDRGAPLSVPYELSDIPALVERFDAGRDRTSLHLEGKDEPIPAVLGESAYRIVREALTNVRKHAPDGYTIVSIAVSDSELVIGVGNDGVGHSVRLPGSRGFGLTGIAERVHTLGGSMYAGADEPDSWKVQVILPLEVAA